MDEIVVTILVEDFENSETVVDKVFVLDETRTVVVATVEFCPVVGTTVVVVEDIVVDVSIVDDGSSVVVRIVVFLSVLPVLSS